jgi:hypothetical protein
MSAVQPPTATSIYPDRSTRLMLLGIFQVMLGCLCALMAVMLIAVSLLGPTAGGAQGPAMKGRMLIQPTIFYLLLAVALIWLGIGLTRARRWAWTLTVVLSWMWLIVGVLGCVMFVFFLGPTTWASIAQQGNVPAEAIMAMQIIGGAFVACIYILAPGAFLLLCHRESVRATCQRRDSKVRWTDRCPMPVLAMSIMFAMSVVSMSSVPAYGWVMPLFGVFLSGAAGATAILSVALLLAYLAWGSYRLHMAAWWGALLFGMAGSVNLLMFSRTGFMKMYEKMGMPADQLEMMRKMGVAEWLTHWGPWMGLVGAAWWLGYLLYVRRYFVHRGEGTTATS